MLFILQRFFHIPAITYFSETSKLPTSVQNNETTHSFLFIKSDLRLVTDLQHSIKAQQSQAYAQKVKLSNLKMMAQTVAYVQEHGFQNKEELNTALSNASAQSTDEPEGTLMSLMLFSFLSLFQFKHSLFFRLFFLATFLFAFLLVLFLL